MSRRSTFIRQFFAALTILSFTLTQALPAWALERGGRAALRPQMDKAGLEEALQEAAAVGEGRNAARAVTVATELGLETVAPAASRGVSSMLVAEVLRGLSNLPSRRRNTRDMTLAALELLRTQAPTEVSSRIPSAETVAAQLDQLIQKGPALDCPTCGTKVAHAVLSDPFTNPQRQQPEELQTPEFQAAEMLNAVLLALSIAQEGRLLMLTSADGHVMPASTAADLRDLLLLAEAHPGFPAEATHVWVGAQMTQAQMREALGRGQTVVAHVGGNHFVQVTRIADGRVEYTDPQISGATREPTPAVATQSEQGFFQWWKGNARPGTAGNVLVGLRPGQEMDARKRLSDEEMAKIIGCCGINATFAHFRSVRKILDAVLRLKYRAPDDTGVLVITRNGFVVRKVQGAPDVLILEMIGNPLFPEMLDLPHAAQENREAITSYQTQRRALLIEEGLQDSGWVPPEWQDPVSHLSDIHESTIEGLYAGNYTIGMGNVGGLYAGWVYTLGETADQYQALNGPALRLKDLVSRWDIAPEFVKLFVRHRLMRELPQDPADPTRLSVLAAFDRLGDRAMKQALDGDEQGEWKAIWKRYLEGRTITIPPDLNRDPVRHVFHLLDQLAGSFGEHPEWEQEVQRRFSERRPAGAREWDWRTYWEKEMRYNLPGHAWAAFVDWVKDFTLASGLVTQGTHGAWVRFADGQKQHRGFSEGTVDLPLLLVLPEIVLGHGRWAMTGDPSQWNAHPQVTEVRAIVNNGAIEADKNNELKREHQERYEALMAEAAALRASATDEKQIRQAERMEQAARRNYGRFEDEAETQEIVTDTRTIVVRWQGNADDYKADLAAGRVKTDGEEEERGTVDPAQPGRLNRPGQTYEGRPVFDRAQAWNRVVRNLRQFQGETEPDYDEVAHRVAVMELAPGSEIATDGVSLATPFAEFVTSHNRPVDIVVYQKKDAAGNVLYEDYMVTSDQAAGIGLFPAPEVDQAAREIARLEEEMTRSVDSLREDLASHRIGDDTFGGRVEEALRRYVDGKDRIMKGEKIVERGPDGKEAVRYRGGFHVKVYHLQGMEKFARITRRLDEGGRQVVDLRISKLNGEPLGEEIRPADETVDPALGDRGRYQSFMEKHIDEIPRILLEQVLAYIRVGPSGAPVAVLDSVPAPGTAPPVEQSPQGLFTRYHKDTPLERLGINREILERHFGAGLEEAAAPAEPPAPGEPANRLPGMKRVVLVGVGSSWRDAKVAKAVYEDLLSREVEVLFYDPVDVSNRGIKLDPKTDLIVGMSWSGSTSSMVRLFEWLQSEGFVTVAITGKPDSNMGLLSKWSGGTLNVFSGNEQSVATTKGFESVLFCLCLLAVHLSQMQGNPDLEEAREGYVKDLRNIADLAYGVLSEREKPKGEKEFDLQDPASTVNRLGRRYRERHKTLWIGSRNIPIHEEGELKTEEIVSSKDKPSMMGIAMDIEDSSWQAVVTHNYDPKAREEDKVVLGFDMTDPDKFDLFVEEIREQAGAGGEMVILAHEADGNPYREELDHLAAESGGRIELVTMPRVRPTLQPLLDALFFFRFSLALAMQREMTQQEIDNSRNLAKSVTVSYAKQMKDLLAVTKTKVVTMVQQAIQWVQEGAQAVARHLQVMSGRVWGSVTDPRMRAIERLPSVLQRSYDGFFGAGSWLSAEPERKRLEQAFGEDAREIRQIVIVTDEEATEYAAMASEDPLGSVEIVYSGKTATEEGRIYTGTMVPVKGYYYRASFDRASGAYTLSYDPDYPQNKGLAAPETQTEAIPAGAAGVTVNGYRYEVDSSSFMRDPKKPQNLAFGLTLRAANPDLLGVKVKIFRASDRALDRELDRQDTLFVLVSRSSNRHQQNRVIPPVEGRVDEERSPEELALPGLARRPETAVVRRAEQLQARGGRFIALSDPQSALAPLGGRALGTVALPSDLDDTSLYSVTYMGLLSIGVKLGRLRGIDTERYQKALSTAPGLVAAVLRAVEVRKRVGRFVRRFGNYKKVQFIGGGQAFADAKENARAARTQGIFAEAQLNDSMWHGPLAAYDPSREKFADRDRRVGVNPSFNPRNDALGVVLMTDRRFFDTALGGDAQVLDSRNARFGLVVKSSDEKLSAVQKVGAAEDGIIPIGDFPDELGNFVNAAIGQYFAAVFAKAHEDALGRPILPPVGGTPPPTAPGPAAPAPGVAPAPSPEEAEAAFRAEVVRSLSRMDFPTEGPMTDRIMEGFRAYVRSGNTEPQVMVFPNPSGSPQQAVLAAIHVDHPGMMVDVEKPIRDDGGNFRSSVGQTVDHTAMVLLDVTNMSPGQLTRLVDKIYRTLLGTIVPSDFRALLAPYRAQMPGERVETLYGTYLVLQQTSGAGHVISSSYVPDPERQAALFVTVPEGFAPEGFADVDTAIRAILADRQVPIARDDQDRELVYRVRYPGERTLGQVPALLHRYVLSGQVNDQAVMDVVQAVESLVRADGGNAGAAPAGTVAPPPTAGLEEKPPVFKREGAGFRVAKAGVIRGSSRKPHVRLDNGADLTAEGGDSRIELAEGVLVESNAVLVAPQGQTIQVGSDTRIMAGAQVWGHATLGAKVEFSGTIDGVAPGNQVLVGDGTTFARGSQTLVRGSALVSAKVTMATSILNSVVRGGVVWQNANLINSILILGAVGNDSMLSRTALYGASPENTTAAAHFNTLISMYAVPVGRRDLADPAERASLERELLALRTGALQERTVTSLLPSGHPTRPEERLVYDLSGERVPVLAQGINIGANMTTSNFDPRDDGTKGPTVVWKGAAFGVGSIASAPAEIGDRVLVSNNAVVSGQDGLAPGTLILPLSAADPQRAVRSRYIDLNRGRLGKGVEEDVEIRMQAIRLLGVLANVAAGAAGPAPAPSQTASHNRVAALRELALLGSYQQEAIADLRRYLERVGVSVSNLSRDLSAKPDEKLQGYLDEQRAILARQAALDEMIREATGSVARAAASAAGLEEHSMANVAEFRSPDPSVYPTVLLEEGSPAFGAARMRGLQRVRERTPLVPVFAAGAFSRFVESVNTESPFYAQAIRERGLANSEGNPSKLTAPLGVSGMGPLLRILESWAEVGARADRPVDVVIVDSAGNREMLVQAINQDRQSANPRIRWEYLNILPAGIPVDQGEGVQVQYRDADGHLQPLSEYNPDTGNMDKPVLRPSGEYGAFTAGLRPALEAGVDLRGRDIVPVYGDQATLYDPDVILAALGHAGEADITGLNVHHRHVKGQWAPSGGVWAEARWQDGASALVIAERNVRDPNAAGIYNPALHTDEMLAVLASPEGTGFPYNAAAPIFSGRFVAEELLDPDKISARLSSKTIDVQTGPDTYESRQVLLTELELTQGVQIGTQHPRGAQPRYKAQMLVMDDGRYHGVKFYGDVQPASEAIFAEGERWLRAQVGVRGTPRGVEVSPHARGFAGEGSLWVTGDVGITVDRRGLWVHRAIVRPRIKGKFAAAPPLFTEGRLLLPAMSDARIPISGTVEISPQVYDQLAAETGLEELTRRQIHDRLLPFLERLAQAPVTVLAMDVDGVTTEQDGDLTDATRDVYDGFIQDLPAGQGGLVVLTTDIGPGQLRDRVENRLTGLTRTHTRSFPISGGEYLNHAIPESGIGVIDDWVGRMGGRDRVLRMEDKRREHAAGEISDESLEHGFDINRGPDGRVFAVDVELDKQWLAAQKAAHQGVDPRAEWVDELRRDLRDAGIGEGVVETLHRAGSASLTWTPPKGRLLGRLAEEGTIDPAATLFVDDSALNFLEFPGVESWPGPLVYIGAHNAELAQRAPNVIQIGRPGEPKPANGPEIAREIVQVARAAHRLGGAAAGAILGEGEVGGKPPVERALEQVGLAAGMEEPLDALVEVLSAQAPAGADAQADMLERMAQAGVRDLTSLQSFLDANGVAPDALTDGERQRLADLADNYDALHTVLSQAPPKGLGLSRGQVIALIGAQAQANGGTFAQEVRGVLDVPDSELPTDAEFDAIVRSAEVVIDSGGNSGRAQLQIARVAGVVPVSEVPVDDDGGNHGAWRKFVGRVVLTGDPANQRANNASLLVRQGMADRLPEKPKTGWAAGESVRNLLMQEIGNAFASYRAQYPDGDPAQEPSLVRSLGTLLSAHRILTQAFPNIMDVKVLSKASGQNVLAVAISLRSGFYNPGTKQTDPSKLKQAALLWNRALGLGPEDGVVFPNSLQPARLHFVYEDAVASAPVKEGEAVKGIRVGDAEIAPEDFFTVTREGRRLVLTDGMSRRLTYDRTAQAYVARDRRGQIQNRFQPFPGLTGDAIRARLAQVPALSIVRGEDHASEEDTIYDNTRVMVWGAEPPAGEALSASPVSQEVYRMILDGETQVRTLIMGPGSEGTSVAPHLWRPEKVRFLRELAQRRRAGQAVPRAIFVFNPSETNDGFGLGPLGMIRNYELIMREVLDDDSVRFEELFPEVVFFDHADPWVLAPNPVVAQEMGVPVSEVDYLRILGPSAAEKQAGKKHGIVKKNRQPLDPAPVLADLRARFGPDNVHAGPYADVRGTVESSRGKVSRAARVLGLTHRLALTLYPERRDALLPAAVREEQRIYREKHEGQDPTPAELAEFLNKVGANTTAAEVQPLMTTGLEELAPAEPVFMAEEDRGPAAVEPAVGPATVTYAGAAFSVTGVGEPIRTVTALLSAYSGLNVVSATTRTEGAAFVVQPDGIARFAVAAHMVGAASAQADILAEDAGHKERVEYLLGELGLAAGVRVHDLKEEYGGDVGRAVAELRSGNEQRGLRTRVVTKDTGLKEIAQFLGVPVEEADLRAGELVAARTNDIWT